MRFEFATATRILFGAGTVREVAPAAKEMGRRALFVTNLPPERSAPLMSELTAAAVACNIFPVDGEPTLDLVRRGGELARHSQCDLVIGFGGGSAIDAAKAIAALLTNTGELMDYVEVIGKGKTLRLPSAPFIAVPTTAGTGAEVTRNAVLASPEHGVKVSLRSPLMLARLAVVDPELTFDLPPALTASSGLDALTQLIEPYVSLRANPMTDGFCVEGMRRVSRSLRRAYHHGRDAEARTDMSVASLLSGLSLANAGLGVVHGYAAPIGGMFPAPHGAVCAALLPHGMDANIRALRARAPSSESLRRYEAVCAALLPHGMDANIRALRARAPSSESLRRYEAVARILTSQPNAAAEEGVEWVRQMCQEFEIPPLSSYGIAEQDVPALAEKASRASSMKANPIALTPDELREVLTRAL